MKIRSLVAAPAALVLLLAGCSKPVPIYPVERQATQANYSSTVHVRYLLTGPGRVDVTMQTPGGTSQKTGVSGTNSFEYDFAPGEFVYISAQNNGTGSHTCEIQVEDVSIVKNDASGEYSIVTCDGRS
jgi:hypothetical protein